MKGKVILVLAIIAIFMVMSIQYEPFATKREKAKSIFDWFNNNPTPSYIAYRDGVKPSNIVEYEDALGLFKSKNFTVDSIEQVL